MALWESLGPAERQAGMQLTPEEGAELDRRWVDHVQRPESAIPWEEVRRKLIAREANDDMRSEYGLRGGVRGKYYERYQRGTNVVVVKPDPPTEDAPESSVDHLRDS